jgi:hypothetical protein
VTGRRAALLAVLAAAVAGFGIGSPYLAARRLGEALASGDPVALERRVDFPLLRQNLKQQLNAAMLDRSGGRAVETPFGAVVAGIASLFVDGMVEAFVTPSGLATLASGRLPARTGGEAGGDEPRARRDPFAGARTSRDALDRFSIWVPDDEGREIRFVLSLSGLSWRLTHVVLPSGQVP